MKPKILVVDDEDTVRQVIAEYMRDSGHTVFEAGSGAEALDIVELEKPDLVFLDVVMPKMNGLMVLQKIKEQYPKTVVVMTTAVQVEDTARQAIELGAYDYVTKPINLQRLEKDFVQRIFG